MLVPPGAGVSHELAAASGSGGNPAPKARLAVQHLRPKDAGIYKCRTDFKKSPTKHYRMNLTILGEKG